MTSFSSNDFSFQIAILLAYYSIRPMKSLNNLLDVDQGVLHFFVKLLRLLVLIDLLHHLLLDFGIRKVVPSTKVE